MTASSSDLPQNSRRANSHATAMASGVATSVATVATRSESRIAVHSVGEMSNTRIKKCSGRGADQESESVFFKNGLRGLRMQKSKIAGGACAGGRGRGNRIDDGRMGIGREWADVFYFRPDLGI